MEAEILQGLNDNVTVASNENKLNQIKYYADVVTNIMSAINNIVKELENENAAA